MKNNVHAVHGNRVLSWNKQKFSIFGMQKKKKKLADVEVLRFV